MGELRILMFQFMWKKEAAAYTSQNSKSLPYWTKNTIGYRTGQGSICISLNDLYTEPISLDKFSVIKYGKANQKVLKNKYKKLAHEWYGKNCKWATSRLIW